MLTDREALLRKLLLKDEISRLDSLLIPDSIA